jgi:hypothetical protein
MTPEQYSKLRDSGMMWEWYPEFVGCYVEDMETLKRLRNEK